MCGPWPSALSTTLFLKVSFEAFLADQIWATCWLPYEEKYFCCTIFIRKDCVKSADPIHKYIYIYINVFSFEVAGQCFLFIVLYLHYFSLTFFPLFFFEWSFASQALASVCVCVCAHARLAQVWSGELCERGPSGQRLRGATCVCVCAGVCVCACMCGRGALLWLAFSLASRFFWVSSLRNLLSARVWEAGAHAKRFVNSESFLWEDLCKDHLLEVLSKNWPTLTKTSFEIKCKKKRLTRLRCCGLFVDSFCMWYFCCYVVNRSMFCYQ